MTADTFGVKRVDRSGGSVQTLFGLAKLAAGDAADNAVEHAKTLAEGGVLLKDAFNEGEELLRQFLRQHAAAVAVTALCAGLLVGFIGRRSHGR
jgi:hypothetical protein